MNRIDRKALKDKVIDCHNHIGVNIKNYGRAEYPYCQSLESLYYKQKLMKVDVNVVFPYSSHLFFNLKSVIKKGLNAADRTPVSELPYEVENKLLMYEIFKYNPEMKDNFIPFLSFDTARKVEGQMKFLEAFEKEYPIYGIKINPTGAQSRIKTLGSKGTPFLQYARERNIPFIFHASGNKKDYYSSTGEALKVIEKHPDIRFALAHALVFNKEYLDRANQMPNVWVDTSALKIQVDSFMKNESYKKYQPIDADFSDHRKVMQALVDLYPETIIWGSDAPSYAYMCKRLQGPGKYKIFQLKGNYEDEKAALDALPPKLGKKVSNTNTLNWLFGQEG